MRKILVAFAIIIILAILCLAFIGIFGRVPDEWEWVVIILAWVTIAMATPSLFQMLWGRPIVETQLEPYAEKTERVLLVYLKNPPVKNRMLRMFGVKRETVQSLTAEIRISEVGSNRVIVPIRHLRIYSDDDPSDIGNNRIILPPTFSVSASMVVVNWDSKKNKAVVPGDRLREPLLLDEGCYLAEIIIFVDGDPKTIFRQFVVGQNADDLIWASRN